ncbi:MAG: hypothetical protein JO270_03725 [Acidobacteriaceae bacterium]|nr:hypothetical protein [Acidobacteriaceae bacterium]
MRALPSSRRSHPRDPGKVAAGPDPRGPAAIPGLTPQRGVELDPQKGHAKLQASSGNDLTVHDAAVGDKADQSYRRSDALVRRRELMDA